MLDVCQFSVRLQFSVTVLKKLHRKTSFREADARPKAKPLPKVTWYSSFFLSAWSFQNGQHKVATVAVLVYGQWSSQCKETRHLSVKVLPFLNSF